MRGESILKNILFILDPIYSHLVKVNAAVGVEIGASYSQWTGKGKFFVKKYLIKNK